MEKYLNWIKKNILNEKQLEKLKEKIVDFVKKINFIPTWIICIFILFGRYKWTYAVAIVFLIIQTLQKKKIFEEMDDAKLANEELEKALKEIGESNEQAYNVLEKDYEKSLIETEQIYKKEISALDNTQKLNTEKYKQIIKQLNIQIDEKNKKYIEVMKKLEIETKRRKQEEEEAIKLKENIEELNILIDKKAKEQSEIMDILQKEIQKKECIEEEAKKEKEDKLSTNKRIKELENKIFAAQKEIQKYQEQIQTFIGEEKILCSGKYVGNRDILIGIYDVYAVSGKGYVSIDIPDKMNILLEVGRNERYNNLEVIDGSTLRVEGGVNIKLCNRREYRDTFDIREDTKKADKDIDEVINLWANIDSMDGWQFENFCAIILRKNGYESVEVTAGSGDQGVDVLAEKDKIKYAIQCKRYSHLVGNKAVQEIYAGKNFYHCHIGIIMTNNYFTESARSLATENGIILWDRKSLENFLKQF